MNNSTILNHLRFLGGIFVGLLMTSLTMCQEPSEKQWLKDGLTSGKVILKIKSDKVIDPESPNYYVKMHAKVPILICRNKGEQAKAIAEYKQNLLDAKLELFLAPHHQIPVVTPDAIEIGFAGAVACNSFQVVQVISKTSCLGRFKMNGISESKLVILKGFDTSKVVDGERLDSLGAIFIPRTETYQAVLGTNTVYVVEPLTGEQLRNLNSSVSNEVRYPKTFRKWKDVSGAFEIEAALVSFDRSEVLLIKKDGTDVKLSLTKLSIPDRKYVIEMLGSD